MEDYPHFWAREIEWAVEELDRDEPDWKIGRLYKKLSITKGDVESSIPFITNDDIKKRIIGFYE